MFIIDEQNVQLIEMFAENTIHDNIYIYDCVVLLFLQETIAKEPIGTSIVTASSACTVGTIPPMTPPLERMEKPTELQGAMVGWMGELEVPREPEVVA